MRSFAVGGRLSLSNRLVQYVRHLSSNELFISFPCSVALRTTFPGLEGEGREGVCIYVETNNERAGQRLSLWSGKQKCVCARECVCDRDKERVSGQRAR